MAAVTLCSDFGVQEEEICHYFHFSSSVCYAVMGADAMILFFLILSLKPALSVFFFTLIKRVFSSSLLPDIRVVSSTLSEVVDVSPVYLHSSL